MIQTNDAKSQARALRRELANYLDDLPGKIERGQADVSDLALRLGKWLTWVSGTLDAGEIGREHPDSIARMGDEFKRVGLSLCHLKTKRVFEANQATLMQLRGCIDDLRSIERSVTHVLG